MLGSDRRISELLIRLTYRGRNESENATLDFKSFTLSGDCLFKNWVSVAYFNAVNI